MRSIKCFLPARGGRPPTQLSNTPTRLSLTQAADRKSFVGNLPLSSLFSGKWLVVTLVDYYCKIEIAFTICNVIEQIYLWAGTFLANEGIKSSI